MWMRSRSSSREIRPIARNNKVVVITSGVALVDVEIEAVGEVEGVAEEVDEVVVHEG